MLRDNEQPNRDQGVCESLGGDVLAGCGIVRDNYELDSEHNCSEDNGSCRQGPNAPPLYSWERIANILLAHY
jgi:hypothetical protein